MLCSEFEVGTSEVIEKAARQLDEFFAGKRKEFDVPLLFVGTDFQKTVWNELSTEPFSERYTEILVAYTVVCIFCQSTKDIQRTYKLPVIQ